MEEGDGIDDKTPAVSSTAPLLPAVDEFPLRPTVVEGTEDRVSADVDLKLPSQNVSSALYVETSNNKRHLEQRRLEELANSHQQALATIEQQKADFERQSRQFRLNAKLKISNLLKEVERLTKAGNQGAVDPATASTTSSTFSLLPDRTSQTSISEQENTLPNESAFKAQIAALEAELTQSKAKIVTLEDEIRTSQSTGISAIPAAQSALSTTATNTTSAQKLEARLFMLEEQVRDYQLQIASKDAQMAKLNKSLEASKAESADAVEKIKKLKGLMASLNKSFQHTKESLAAREEDVHLTMVQLEEGKVVVREAQEQVAHIRAQAEQAQIAHSCALDEVQATLLEHEGRERHLDSQLASLREEFTAYKLKAHAALEKASSVNLQSQLADAQNRASELERTNRTLETERADAQRKVQRLQEDVSRIVDEFDALKAGKIQVELSLSTVEGQRRDLGLQVDQLNTALADRTLALQERERLSSDQIEALKTEHAKLLSIAQNEKLQLQEELTAIQETLLVLETERLEKRHSHTSPRNSPIDLTINTSPLESYSLPLNGQRISRSISSTSLAESTVTREDRVIVMHQPQDPSILTLREKELLIQVEQLSALLSETQLQVDTVFQDHTALQRKLDEFERADRRSNLNIEYLKNIVLVFLETEDKGPLLPVIKQVLQLSSEEADRLMKAAPDAGYVGSSLNPLSFLGLG